MISIIELSRQLGVRKQTVFKVAKRLGIETQKLRTDQSRGQLTAHVSEDDARDIRNALEAPNEKNSGGIEYGASGLFYLIQLEPVADPGRYKVGFATDLEQRLRSHKTSAPFSTIVKHWPCKSLWEKTAIDCVSQGSQKLHTEVFRAKDISSVAELADRFFELMPDPN